MTNKSGFTLIELSIVIVLIGLLVGGVLAGRVVIRSSEIRSTLTDLDAYKAAYNNFQLKYNCLPGDCAKATTYFGAQNADPATCRTTASTGTLTCNGNGTGTVEDSTWEMYRFWQHLAIAGMIKGKYTGIAGPGGVYNHILGTNAPATAIPGAGFAFSYLQFQETITTTTYAIDYGHLFWLGSATGGTNIRPQRPIMTATEAKDFDKKIDDGKPATGSVIARTNQAWGNSEACTTSTSATDLAGLYNTSSSTITCAFMIKTGSTVE